MKVGKIIVALKRAASIKFPEIKMECFCDATEEWLSDRVLE